MQCEQGNLKMRRCKLCMAAIIALHGSLCGAAVARASEVPAAAAPATAGPQDLQTIPVSPTAEAGAEPVSEPEHDGLEEVIVTAQRRQATVQETPISIEAFNADRLAQRGIDGLDDLSANVPGMVVEPFPTHNATLRITVRGVGVTDAQVTQDPAVGIYIDGVYLARSVGLALDLADLERIEVLRGPQGTLYGRNTTGGAVNILTRRPSTDAQTMTHQLTIGSRNQITGKSVINLPVTDDLAVKLALLAGRRDGYVENTGPGGDFGDRQEKALRFDLRWLVGEGLIADYTYDWTDLKYYNYMFQAITPSNTPHGLADLFKPFAQDNSVYSSERLGSLASGAPMEPSGSRISGHTLTLRAPLGEDYELKYIGAYRKLTDDEYSDLGGGAGSLEYRVDTNYYDGPAATMINGGPTPLSVPQVFQDQMSHELQLSGKLTDSLSFITGVYYFEEDGGENGHPVHHILNAVVDPVQLEPLLSTVPALHDLLRQLALPKLSAFWDYGYGIHNEAAAAFGQLTWAPDFADGRLRFTGGLRQSWDKRSASKDFVQTQYLEGRLGSADLVAVRIPDFILPGTDVFDNVQASSKYENLSPSGNLQYDVTKNATTYLSYATAYKSGGFNVRDPQISGASGPASDGTNYGFGFTDGFKPEKVHSIEAGLKSEWMGRRLRFNTSVFNTDYRDMQTNFLIAGSISDTKSRNAGKARIRGVELDGAFVISSGLIVALQYSYLDAKVLEVIDVNGDNVAELYPFIAAPKQSYVASVDWTFLHGSWGDLRAYGTYQYVGDRSGFVITEERRGLTAIDGYGLFNARLSLSDLHVGAESTLDIALWGKNLADKEYPLTAVDNLPHADRAVLWGEPRSFGLELVYRFR